MGDHSHSDSQRIEKMEMGNTESTHKEKDSSTECRNNCGQSAGDENYGFCSNCYKEAVEDVDIDDSEVDDLMSLDPEETFEWDETRIDEALIRLDIEIGKTWSQSKKAFELINAIKKKKEVPEEKSEVSINKDELMLKILTSQQEALAKMMEKVKVNNSTESTKKKKSKNKQKENGQPDKLSRGIDYDSFVQWEKSWNRCVISEKINDMDEAQKTAKFLGFCSTELLDELEKDFKISLSPKQKLDDVIKTIKDHLKSRRPMLMARYRFFTRNQYPKETFSEWYRELLKIAHEAEIETLTKDEILSILIAAGMKDQKLRWKMLKELKTPGLQEVIDFVNNNSLSNDEDPPSHSYKKESKSGNEPKNREPTKSVKPRTNPENDHQKKKSSGVDIPRQSKKKANHQKMMPSKNPDTKKNYSNLQKMSNNGSARSMMDIRMHPPTMHQSPMYQPNMHPYEAQQHFGNTRNHP